MNYLRKPLPWTNHMSRGGNREFTKPRRQRQWERHWTKELMSSTMAVHMRYNSWYMFLPFSARQQREMNKFCVVWTWRKSFSETQGLLVGAMRYFRVSDKTIARKYRIVPTSSPWVSEYGRKWTTTGNFLDVYFYNLSLRSGISFVIVLTVINKVNDFRVWRDS